MKGRISARVLTMCALLMVNGSTALAEHRKLVFPIGHTVSAAPERLGFCYGWRVGLATASVRKESERYGVWQQYRDRDFRVQRAFDVRSYPTYIVIAPGLVRLGLRQ